MDLWMQIKSMYEKSDRQIKILDGIAEQGIKELREINISPESTMEAIIINTNGIIIDNWIRILGQSSEHHAGIVDFCERIGREFGKMMVIAIDIVGGLFAINSGEFEDDIGMVWYFAPDIYPFLWAKECNIETASKNISPLGEIIKMYFGFKKEFNL